MCDVSLSGQVDNVAVVNQSQVGCTLGVDLTEAAEIVPRIAVPVPESETPPATP